MIYVLFPIVAIAVVAFYLGHLRAVARRRNAQSWESLLAQLRLDWSARELSDGAEGISTTPENVWQRMEGPKGLCVMYQNARVMMEMADYAARNSDSVDRKLLETLRSDAIHIRVFVLIALGQYAFRQLNESICVNAYRAASMYVEMSDRMTELLQVQAAGMVPDFSAAMS
ncbi:MAG: hypothetical protein ACLQLH_09685 [Terracidiphilus sp.]|jgi:hypothetical protein